MKNKKRILIKIFAFVILFVVVLFAIGTNNITVEGDFDWSHYQAKNFAGGDGSAADPFQITTPREFAILEFADSETAYTATHDNYYVIMNDIDLINYDWKETWFYGTLLSTSNANYAISNVTVVDGESMFETAYIIKNVTFDNITGKSIVDTQTDDFTIEKCYIKNSHLNSGFVNNIVLTTDKAIKINNCYVVDSYFSSSVDNASIGGIAGYASFKNVSNSYGDFITACSVNNCDFLAKEGQVIGGILGSLVSDTTTSRVSVTNCTCENSHLRGNDCIIGGILGCLDSTNATSNVFLQECSTFGGGICGSTTTIDTKSICGGIVGEVTNTNYSTISLCSNAMPVSGGIIMGGIVGNVGANVSDLTISSTINKALIDNLCGNDYEDDEMSYLGGIIGKADCDYVSFNKVVNLGNVTNNKDNAYVGGFIGYLDTEVAHETTQIESSYTAGVVKSVYSNTPTNCNTHYDFGYAASANINIGHKLNNSYYGSEFNDESGIYVGQVRTALTKFSTDFNTIAKTKIEIYSLSIGSKPVAGTNAYYVLPKGSSATYDTIKYYIYVYEGYGTYEGEDIKESSLYNNFYPFSNLAEAIASLNNYVDEEGYKFTPNIYSYIDDFSGEYIVLNQNVVVDKNSKTIKNKVIENLNGEIANASTNLSTSYNEYIYKVFYDKNGGNGDDCYQMVHQGNKFITIVNVYERPGYEFILWDDGVNTIEEESYSNDPVTSNITIKVIWDALEMTIKFDRGNESATGDDPEDIKEDCDEIIVLPANPYTLTKKVFAGWSDGENVYEAGANYTVPTDNITLTALWEDIKYNLTIEANGGTGTMETLSGCIGDTITMPECTITPPEGKIFRAWCVGRSSYEGIYAYQPGDTYTFSREYNEKLYAIWVDIVTITFVHGDHGTGDDVVVVAGKGLSYTLPENNYFEADTGYEFLNWYIVDYANPAYPSTKTKAPGESIVLNGATARITAKYDLAKLNLTFDGNGETSGEQEVIKVKPNEYCVLPECTFEKTGYKFNGWLDEDNNILYHPGVIYKMPEDDYELKAQWLSVSVANFRVGDYTFPTFESALEFAYSGATIKLINDLESTAELASIRTIIIDKNITIDLNNHHISEYAGKYNLDNATTLDKALYYYMIVNEGVTLTITDNSANKKGYFETSYININQESITPNGYGIYAKGNVTLSNGTIQNSVNSNRTKGSLITIFMYSSSTSSNSFTMTGGTIKMQDNTYLIKSNFNLNYDTIINIYSYTSVNITGGKFTGSTSNTISKLINSNSNLKMSGVTVDLMDYINFMPFVINAGATISNCTIGFKTSSMANLFTASYAEEVVFNNDTINIGGTIINLGNAGASATFNDCTVTALNSYSFVTGSGTVTVNSGTYTSTYNSSNGFFNATGGVYIIDGTFIGSKALKGVATENVSGGKFSVQVPAVSVIDGYYATTIPDEDGYYGVAELTSKEDAYAILNYGVDSEEYYASLPQAISAADGKENAVVTVNKSCTENSVIDPTGKCKIVIPDGITLTCQGFYVSKDNCSGETLLIEEGGTLIITADTGLRGVYGTCTMTNNGTITTKGIYDAVAGWVNNGTITITSSYSPYVTNFTNNGTITGTVSYTLTVKGARIQSTIEDNKLYTGVYSYNKTTNEFEPETKYLLVRDGEPVSLYYGTDLSGILQDGDVVKLVKSASGNIDALTINHNITLDGNGYTLYATLIINNSCTFKDVQISSININTFSSNGNIDITLVGNNTITSSANYPTFIANGNVRFIGNGNLELTSTHESQNAMKIDGDLVINANVTMECNTKCILIGQSNSLTISNGTYKAKLYETFDNGEEDFELTITGGRFIENVKASLGENYHTMYEDGYHYVRYLVVSLDNFSLDYGNSLGLLFEFTIEAYDEESISALILTNEWHDVTVNKVSDNKFEIIYNDIIMYKFNELFDLQLNVDGESLEYNDLSVKALLVHDLNNEPSDELKDLIYSIIAYADAAQLYKEYDVENLLSTDIEGYVAPVFTNLLATDTNLVHATEIESIYACGVYYDYVNKLYAKFNASQISELNVYIDDVKVSEENLINLGDGNYKVYTDEISPDKFDQVFTFTIYDGDTLIDTLEYSFASYVYAKQGNTNANANLCKAAYNYYLATLEYLY